VDQQSPSWLHPPAGKGKSRCFSWGPPHKQLALLTKTKRRHLHKCCLYSAPSLKHHNYLYEIKASIIIIIIIIILEASDGKNINDYLSSFS
jgi:hypothetical protein